MLWGSGRGVAADICFSSELSAAAEGLQVFCSAVSVHSPKPTL